MRRPSHRPSGTSDVLVIGGASTDFVGSGTRLPGPGDELSGEQFLELCGGKGANQAVAVARLGGSVALITRVGKDRRGDVMIAHLERQGVETQFCIRDSDEQTSAILLMIDRHGTKQTLTVPGAVARLSAADVDHACELFERARLLVIQFEPSIPTVLHAIDVAHEFGRPVFLDGAPAEPVDEKIWQRIHLARMNAKEARHLTGVKVDDLTTARQAAAILIARGVRVVAIEASAHGNLLMWPDGEEVLPLVPIRTVDKTGAGDAFIAALAVGYLEGRSWTEAGWFANAAAALTTMQLGAEPALPTRQQVFTLLKEIGKAHLIQ